MNKLLVIPDLKINVTRREGSPKPIIDLLGNSFMVEDLKEKRSAEPQRTFGREDSSTESTHKSSAEVSSPRGLIGERRVTMLDLKMGFGIITLLFSLLLTSCSEVEVKEQNPAQEQIQQYTQKLEDCKEETAKKVKEELNKQNESEINTSETDKKEEANNGYSLKEDDIYLGNKEAKVILIEYFSPTCPHCVHFHSRIFPQIKEKYIDSGKILYISREFIASKQDLDATILAKCQRNIETYYKFIDVLLKQQSNWAYSKNYREILTNIASLGGVSAEEYAKCLQDTKTLESLMNNTKLLAKESNFLGTPAFIINGKLHLKSYSIENLSESIDKLLDPKN